MLSYEESLKILKETNALLEGHFVLSSGLHSKQYIQCAKLLSHPQMAESICSSLCEKIKVEYMVKISKCLFRLSISKIGQNQRMLTVEYKFFKYFPLK